jgi:hypothetical protein
MHSTRTWLCAFPMILFFAMSCSRETTTVTTTPSTTSSAPFQFGRGIQIPNPAGIHEAYSLQKTARGFWLFQINVSASHIPTVFKRLIAEVPTPGYLIVETPTIESEEVKLRKTPADPFHKDVFYWNGISTEQALTSFTNYEEILVNDGGVNIGFGSHSGIDEVFIGAYKIFEVYANNPEKFQQALTQLGLKEEPKIKTVWDTFTQSAPGTRQALTGQLKTKWDMLTELKAQGLQFAERRAD